MYELTCFSTLWGKLDYDTYNITWNYDGHLKNKRKYNIKIVFIQ
jgi:hypothetical protein